MKKSTLILSAFLLSNMLSAQCLLQEISLNERVQQADVIIEGKVIEKSSFWNTAHNYIYTATTIEIYKVFKGEPKEREIKIITEGGAVGLQGIFVNPVLKLSKGQTGIFFGNTISNSLPVEGALFSASAGPQGFIEYDLVENKGVDPFVTYDNISENLYNKITSLTGKSYHVVRPFDTDQPSDERSVPAITGFSPLSVAAGIGTVLTINGSGFGATQGNGYVSFKNADNGGATYVSVTELLYYISWSDAMIQIRVPGDVSINTIGTGTIRVTNNSAQTGTSSSSLTIQYVRFESVYFGEIFKTFLYDAHGNGGYLLHPTSAIAANVSATNAFNRALSTWNCADHIKWQLSPVTTNVDTTAWDSVSVVRYASQMPAGVAAYSSSPWTGASDGFNLYLVITEMDVTYKSSLNWCYGPANPTSGQVDFESVTLHEIGHSHTLNHVINTGDVMHYQTAPPPQTRRTLLWDNVQSGNNAINLGQAVAADCGLSPMVLYYNPSCQVSIDESTKEISSGSVYPNPASGAMQVNIPQQLSTASSIDVFNSLGEKFPVSVIGDNLLDVSSLSNGIYFLRVSDEASSGTYKFGVDR